MEIGIGRLKGKIDTAIGKAKEKVRVCCRIEHVAGKGAAPASKGKADSAVSGKLDKARKAVHEGYPEALIAKGADDASERR